MEIGKFKELRCKMARCSESEEQSKGTTYLHFESGYRHGKDYVKGYVVGDNFRAMAVLTHVLRQFIEDLFPASKRADVISAIVDTLCDALDADE